MGIGFDVFKAKVGWNLADGAMELLSDAIEKGAAENAAKEQLAKEQSDKDDMLKTIVFLVGFNCSLDRNWKKAIAASLSAFYDEKISLFSIEDKIDAAYEEMKTKGLKKFFSGISSINTDRKYACLIYAVVMLLYMNLHNGEMVLPAHTYNLALIKKFFALSRAELTQSYEMLGSKINQDVDDLAEVFEELTSEESIKEIEEANPALAYVEPAEPVTISISCENPKEEVEKLYNETIQQCSDDGFAKRFALADSNQKKTLVAINAYAKNCIGEEILVVYDDTLFGNGKAGFILTNKKLYIHNSFEDPIEIDLSSVISITASSKETNPFITINDVKVSTSMLTELGTELVCNFLEKAIPLAKQIELPISQ